MLTPIIHTCTDLHVEVVPVPFKELINKQSTETSAQIRERVIKARAIQEERYKDYPGIHCNAQIGSKLFHKVCVIDDEGQTILKAAMDRLGLSARAYDRILKVSRTIADLEGAENISVDHLSEAINFRSLDRENWGK